MSNLDTPGIHIRHPDIDFWKPHEPKDPNLNTQGFQNRHRRCQIWTTQVSILDTQGFHIRHPDIDFWKPHKPLLDTPGVQFKHLRFPDLTPQDSKLDNPGFHIRHLIVSPLETS